MKSINYYLSAMCFGLAFGLSNAQETYVTGTAKVKVQPNTLVYFGDNLNVTSTTNAVLENAGNILVEGDYVNASATGANFLSTWDVPSDNTSYGQVIINENSSAGRLTMEKGTIDPAVFNWGQFAMPFHFANVDEAMDFLFGTVYSTSNNRYQKSMMVWDNVQKPEFDHFNAGDALGANSPTAYYILNLEYNSGNIKPVMQTNAKLAYRGVPSNEAFLNIPMNTNMYYFGGVGWNNWKGKKNTYLEKYQTYIDDKVRMTTDDAGYGRNYFQFGNPYTSNIDLAYIGSPASPGYDDGNDIDGLLAVARVADLDYTAQGGSASSGMIVATYDEVTNVWGGDASALLVKPFEPFIVVLDTDATNTGNRVINFSDKLKTFSMTPNSLGGGVVTPKNGEFDGGNIDVAEDRMSFTLPTSAKPRFYQVGLSLHHSNGAPTGNKAYVIVTNSGVINGTANALESEYSDFGSRTGFYLAQENQDGSPVFNSTRKMHINAVNMAYVNKPIPMFFNRKSGDLEGYYIKADLFYRNIFTQLTEEENNYIDGNSFFFYDKREDVLMPITTDFNYYVDVSEKALENRYTVYWNGGPVLNKGEMDETLIAGSTIIYKDQQTHKIRFNDQWDSANVKVYDMSGRNIMSFENVDTQADFELKLPAAGVYVVKAESNTGEVYTQKIIK